jgi:TetR/AcrR family transcriptional regulator
MRDAPEEKNETAQRILQAADELLVEAGFDGLSMSAVARAAGVNKALVFYYFSTKAQLIERVLQRYYSAHLQALEQALNTGGTLRDRFHRLVDAYLDFMDENRRYPRLVQQQTAGGGEYHELIRKSLGPLFQWTERLLRDVAPEGGPRAARHLFVTMSGIVLSYYTYAPVLAEWWGQDPMSAAALRERREHVHWMVEAILAGLGLPDEPD